MTFTPAALAALAAALLFGASTPFAKLLAGDLPPLLLAGLLYLGSGMGLGAFRLLRERRLAVPALELTEWGWLLASIVVGGLLAPVLLMVGLADTAASDASLLLNFETVLTTLLAWIVFRESADSRLVLGMALIVAGGVVLAWPRGGGGGSQGGGVACIVAACLCWAADNNITRKISGADAVFIAASKGLIAGVTNLALAFLTGAALPPGGTITAAMTVGFLGYGVSLVLFVLALRGLGAARAGAYFSTAPFLGATIAVVAFGAPRPGGFWLAAALMASGVALHLTEQHSHQHTHEALQHAHPHRHDAHHRNAHDCDWDGAEPHTHAHRHEALSHDHPHAPDEHHRHRH